MNINSHITELVRYGVLNKLVSDEDVVYVTNRLLEVLEISDYEEDVAIMEASSTRTVQAILDDI